MNGDPARLPSVVLLYLRLGDAHGVGLDQASSLVQLCYQDPNPARHRLPFISHLLSPASATARSPR